MKTIKITWTIVLIMIAGSWYCQNTQGVSIKPTVSPPESSAMLDVDSNNKGAIFPRISLDNIDKIFRCDDKRDYSRACKWIGCIQH